MKVPKVDKFCYFFKLKYGGIIIGGISLVISVLFISVFSIFLTRMMITFNSLEPNDQDFFQPVVTALIVMYTFCLLYFSTVFIAALMLIIGIVKRNHYYLILHQIITGVLVIASFIIMFQLTIVTLIPAMLTAITSIYFFICINSLYSFYKLKSRDREISNESAGY